MPKVRATRAYMAGFGTAGSLVAGAAILFILASAIVSFRGWPAVSNDASPSAVFVGTQNPDASRAASTRVTAVLAGLTAPAAGVAAGTGPGGPSHVAVVQGGRLASSPTAPASISSSEPRTTSCLTGCTPPPPVVAVTNTVGATVASTGASLGAGVSGATSLLGGIVGKVVPPLGQTVTSAGNQVGKVTTQATGTAGGVISQTGKTLNGLLTHKH